MTEHNADDPTSPNNINESIEVPERQQYVNKKMKGIKEENMSEAYYSMSKSLFLDKSKLNYSN